MKEMEYSIERKIEVLDTGYCFGLLYYIMNLGTHPTAYIRIPKNHKYYKKDYDDIDLLVHGGLTYARNHLWISKTQKIEGWFIGWDYGHYGDYAGYEEMFPVELKTGGKKWTTEEIFKEVKEACYQLVKGAEEIEELSTYRDIEEFGELDKRCINQNAKEFFDKINEIIRYIKRKDKNNE